MTYCIALTKTYFERPDFGGGNNADLTAVESFNLETMQWSHEPPFPFTPVWLSTSIPFGNTFLSVGGYTNNIEARDDIFKV